MSMNTCSIDDLAAWIDLAKGGIIHSDESIKDQSLLGNLDTGLLIIDFRNTFEFEACYIPRLTVHLIIPIMLFSRATYTAAKVEVSLGVRSLRYQQSFRLRHTAKHIVLIGGENADSEVPRSLQLMHAKLVADDCENARIFWLKEGFQAFKQKYPSQCHTSAVQRKHPHHITGLEQLKHLATSQPSPFLLNSMGTEATSSVYYTSPVELLPFLFIGNDIVAKKYDDLHRLGIGMVICVAKECAAISPHFPSDELRYVRFDLKDDNTQDMMLVFHELYRLIESVRRAKSRALVHCFAGRSRSATCCISYIMRKCRLSVKEAYTFVKEKQPKIAPNFHLLGQLHAYAQDQKRSPGFSSNDLSFQTMARQSSSSSSMSRDEGMPDTSAGAASSPINTGKAVSAYFETTSTSPPKEEKAVSAFFETTGTSPHKEGMNDYKGKRKGETTTHEPCPFKWNKMANALPMNWDVEVSRSTDPTPDLQLLDASFDTNTTANVSIDPLRANLSIDSLRLDDPQ